MKVFAAVAAGFLLCATASFAQINVQGEDGSTVSIGPGGITINGKGSGSHSNVRLGPGGIQIDSDNGYKRSKVNLGTGLNVRTTKGTVSRTSTTRAKRVGSTTVKTTTVNTATRNIKPSGASADEQVRLIELKIYGQSYAGKPLLARVEKLEIENLGQKGSGPLNARINILAKELGVSLSGTSTAVVTAEGSTVEITSTPQASTTINIKESAPPGTAVAVGHELSSLVINENHQIVKGHCNGNAIVVNGDHCNLQLSGKPGLVTLNGNHNRVQSEKFSIVVANGNYNNVTWSHPQGAPHISNNGKYNQMHGQ